MRFREMMNRLLHRATSATRSDALEAQVAQQISELQTKVEQVERLHREDPDKLAKLVHDVRGATFERKARRGEVD